MSIKLNPRNMLLFVIGGSFLYLAYLIIWTAKESLPQIEVELKDIVSYIVLAVEMGGKAVARIYAENNDLEVYSKAKMDVGQTELLTRADLISNMLMIGLLRRFSLLKVITEEKGENKIKNVDKYKADNYEIWLGMRQFLSKLPTWKVPLRRIVIWVDPLDATQEYTEGLTDYVTCMACIAIDGKPFIGAIHSPFKNETIVGMVDFGLISSKTGHIKINRTAAAGISTVLVSRSHAGDVSKILERAFAGNLALRATYAVEPAGGAGYKTLRLIRQTADLYVHTTAIKKWDICAGDAIIRAAGGALISLADGLPLDYSIQKEGTGELHTGGILMAISSPFSIYERMKKSRDNL